MNFVGLDLEDDRWGTFLGGYRVPYDPRRALRALEKDENVADAWNELWEELHHQGDLGEASFAAVPHRVRIHELRSVPDWNTYALVATIELARDAPRNPCIPSELQISYDIAWNRLFEIGLRELKSAEEPTLTTSIIAVLAIAKRLRSLAQLAAGFTEDERQEMLMNAGWS